MIPLIAKAIPTSAYNPKSNITGFQADGLRIVIGSRQMNIYGTDDEERIRSFTEWLIHEIDKHR